MIPDRTGVLDLEATAGVVGRNVEHHGTPTPLLPLERQILQEVEVVTPQRMGAHRPGGGGGGQAPEPQLPLGGTRAVPQIFPDVQTGDVGSDRQNDAWSPRNVLVDTVARMQLDLADLRAENRLLRTPGVPPVVHTPRKAAFTTTKVPRFGGTTSWEQYRQVFDAIVLSNGWDEAVVDIHSEGVVPLRPIPDIIGLAGRRSDAAKCRILQGRDVRCVRVLVPDPQSLDQNFHDVTIVDMGDVPESSVSIPELSLLRQQWPPAVLSHMVWLQQEIEGMRAEAKQRFRQTRPSSCVYYGTWIKCDMYRHVAKFHLDLAQLWRCPVSWCTMWKGTPQDCMDHVRGGGA